MLAIRKQSRIGRPRALKYPVVLASIMAGVLYSLFGFAQPSQPTTPRGSPTNKPITSNSAKAPNFAPARTNTATPNGPPAASVTPSTPPARVPPTQTSTIGVSPTPVDWRALFLSGALSPGYQQNHRENSATPLAPVSRDSYFALTINPALAPSGRLGFRAELTPFAYHGLVVEYSLVSIRISGDQVKGTMWDFGYHFFPFGRHLHGIYLGPRISFGSGIGNERDIGDGTVFRVKADLVAIGGDAGLQVVFGPICMNIGGGAARATVKLSPDRPVTIPEEAKTSLRNAGTEHEEQAWFPLVTGAIGIAFLRTRGTERAFTEGAWVGYGAPDRMKTPFVVTPHPNPTDSEPSRSARTLLRVISAAAVVAGAWFLFSGVASAGLVKGKVTGADKLLNPVWNEAKDVTSNRFSFREPSPTVRAEFRQLFAYAPKEICLAAIGTSPAHAPEKPVLFKIGGGRTNPVTLVVAPGTTLEFFNNDPFPHRPFIKGNSTFAPADMKGKSARQWKVPAGAAVYEVFDELAPSVHSWIVAEPNLAGVAFPQRDSTYTFFSGLPAGEYTLQAFFSGKKVGHAKTAKVGNEATLEVKEPINVGELVKEGKE